MPPEAICAYNDDFAIALLSALAAAGVGVPDDVAVIGVDDVPLGALVTPSLTTVTADYNRFGEAIAEATRAAIEGEGQSDGLSLPDVRVVPRESA
jgi:DNA-binding LacI/PurR family transcriptional regulator